MYHQYYISTNQSVQQPFQLTRWRILFGCLVLLITFSAFSAQFENVGSAAVTATAAIQADGESGLFDPAFTSPKRPNPGFDYATGETVIDMPADGVPLASTLFGMGNTVLPTPTTAGTGQYLGAIYTIDGEVAVDFNMTFTLDNGAVFATNPVLGIRDQLGHWTGTQMTSAAGRNVATFTLYAGATPPLAMTELALSQNDLVMLLYKVSNLGALAEPGQTINMTVELKTSSGVVVNPSRTITVARSVVPMTISLAPIETGNLFIGSLSDYTQFTGEPSPNPETTPYGYISDAVAQIGKLQINWLGGALKEDGVTPFTFQTSPATIQLVVTGGQFGASYNPPGKVFLSDRHSNLLSQADSVTQDDGGGWSAIWNLDSTELQSIVNANGEALLRMQNDGSMPVNTVENPPHAVFRVNFDNPFYFDYYTESDLRKIDREQATCIVDQIPSPNNGMYSMSIWATNGSAVERNIWGYLYNQNGELLWIDNLNTDPLLPGASLQTDSKALGTLTGFIWDGYATLKMVMAAPQTNLTCGGITKAFQTLTFNRLSPTTYGNAPLTLNATASSGLTVGYTATGPCTITGNTLTFTGAGTCNVTASQPGNTNYQAASSVTQTFTINKTPLSLTADDKTVNEGSAIPTLTVTAEGFVNGDTTASLDNFTLTTTATASSPAGVYPITVTASDANYNLTLRNGLLTIQAAGFNVTQTSDTTSLAEGGGTDTLSVVLKFAPLAEVSVVILPDSQLDLGNGGGVPLTQTFTPSNWNTPQTVTVRAVDDTVIEGTHAGWLAFRTASTDTTFHNKVVADLKATILDNDAGVIVPTYPVAVTTNQKIATYPVQLSTIPTSPVTLTLSSNDPAAILSPATLTFATDASALEPQWVTVTLSKNSYRYLVTVTHTITQGNDANYPTTLAIEDVSLAQFSRSQYSTSQLMVNIKGQGRLVGDIGGLECQNNRGVCKVTYLTETAVRLTPIPTAGYQFGEWEGSADCFDGQLLMKPGDNKRCLASFVPISTAANVTLSVNVSSGVGQVTSNTGVMSCQPARYGRGNICQGTYVPGTLVILTPVPATGYQFSRWTGDKDCTDGMVLMNVKKICNAVFASTTGKRSSLEEDTNRQTCDDTGGQSGISVNGQAFSSCATVTLSDTVTIRGEIPVLPEDVGQTAELVVYAAYWPLEEVEETMPHYLMLDNHGQIWPWDEDPTTLVAFHTGVVLAPVQTVDLYQGHFLGTGKLSIFLGYRLGDGMVVVSPREVEVIIR